jgi:Fur family transcriptional regulator, ferric uptake regulator
MAQPAPRIQPAPQAQPSGPLSDQLSSRQQQLLQTLRAAESELSGQDLHAQLRRSSTPMGLATVYRHLRQLQQWGLVRCRHLPSGEALFAPTERDDHHLTCVDCGRTQRLSHCPVHAHDLPSGELEGFLPLFHTLEFFGLCADCQRRHGREPELEPSQGRGLKGQRPENPMV